MTKCTIYLYTRNAMCGEGRKVLMYEHCTCPAFDEGHLEKGFICFLTKVGKRIVANCEYIVEEEKE